MTAFDRIRRTVYLVEITTFSGAAVDKSISATEANRNFSRILRRVEEGESYVVTSHGEPVARIVPAKHVKALNAAAKRRLLAHLKRVKSRPIRIIGAWARDELYEREPARRRS